MKISGKSHLSMLAALAIAASGLAAAGTSARTSATAPAAVPISSAATYLNYRQCLAAESNACLFEGPLGPELPDTPEEEVIYAQCLDDAVALCLSLFPG
jgi:hypothetical protein